MQTLLPKIFAFLIFAAVIASIWIPSPEKLHLSFTGSIKDLRIWSTVLLLLQCILYMIF